MKVYNLPCHDRGHINVMLVLQSSSQSLPGSSSEACATSGCVCNFSNDQIIEDLDVIEEAFLSINEEEDRGIKQEEIPGGITFPDMKCEPDEVSYICICLLLVTFYQCPRILFFL